MSNNLPYKIDGIQQSLFSVATPMNNQRMVTKRAVSQNNVAINQNPIQTEGRSKSNIRMTTAIPFDEGFHGDKIRPTREIRWKPQFIQKDNDFNKFKQMVPTETFKDQHIADKQKPPVFTKIQQLNDNFKNLQFKLNNHIYSNKNDKMGNSIHKQKVDKKIAEAAQYEINKVEDDSMQIKSNHFVDKNSKLTVQLGKKGEFTVKVNEDLYGQSKLDKCSQLLPLYMELYFDAMKIKYNDQVWTRDFNFQEFLSYTNESTDGAAPFNEIANNDLAGSLDVRLKAETLWKEVSTKKQQAQQVVK